MKPGYHERRPPRFIQPSLIGLTGSPGSFAAQSVRPRGFAAGWRPLWVELGGSIPIRRMAGFGAWTPLPIRSLASHLGGLAPPGAEFGR